MAFNRDEIIRRLGFTEGDPNRFRITNLDSQCIRQHGIDFRVSNVAKKFDKTQSIVLGVDKPKYEFVTLDSGDYFVIHPGEYWLMSSIQEIEYLPNDVLGTLDMRSKNHRSGLDINMSGRVEAGYKGPISWGVSSSIEVKIPPYLRMVQLTLEKLADPLNENHLYPKRSSGYNSEVTDARADDEKEMELVSAGKLEEILKSFNYDLNQ